MNTLSDDQWIEIAETCVRLDFDSKEPNGYLNAIRAVGELAIARYVAQPAVPTECKCADQLDCDGSCCAQAAQPVEPAKGFAIVPIHPNREMERVFQEEGWEWRDVLAAANAITEEEYNTIAEIERLKSADEDAKVSAIKFLNERRARQAERDALRTENEALRLDAERWKFWRSLYDINHAYDQNVARAIERAVTPEQLDAEVDKAITTLKKSLK